MRRILIAVFDAGPIKPPHASMRRIRMRGYRGCGARAHVARERHIERGDERRTWGMRRAENTPETPRQKTRFCAVSGP
jgi:hypothetical protein